MEIGVDIIEINRIKNACRRKKFENRFFTACELTEISAKKSYYTHLAGKFAAKEAVAKALGTGFSGIKWQDIEVLNEESGQPVIVLRGKALEIFKTKGFKKMLITISHSREYAIAFAVALGGALDEGSKSCYNEKNGPDGNRRI